MNTAQGTGGCWHEMLSSSVSVIDGNQAAAGHQFGDEEDNSWGDGERLIIWKEFAHGDSRKERWEFG